MILLLTLIVFAQADPSSEAVTTVSGSSSVCESDIAQFCASEKFTSSRCEQFKCLKNHLTEISGPCALYIQEKELQKESCKNDTATFCASEQSRWGKRRCLFANVEKLNPTCAAYVQEKMKEMEKEWSKDVSPTACDADAATLCATVTGFSGTLLCMKQNFEALSFQCKRFFWRLKRNSTHTYGHGHHEGYHNFHHEEGPSGSHHEKGPSGSHHEEGRPSFTHQQEGGDRSHHEGRGRGRRGPWSHSGDSHHENGADSSSWKFKKGGCSERLKQACGTDLTTHCSTVEQLRDMKECLILKWSSLNKNCTEFILNPFGNKNTQTDGVVVSEEADVAPVEVAAGVRFEIEKVEPGRNGPEGAL